MLQTAFRPSCMNRTSVFEWHKRFKESRVSVADDERCGRSKEVRTQELICQRIRVWVTMLSFQGSSERDSVGTLQIRSVVFPPGQCASQQLHSCHRLFDQDGHHDSFPPSIESRPCSL